MSDTPKDRPFPCRVPGCDMAYKTRHGLVVHLQDRHGIHDAHNASNGGEGSVQGGWDVGNNAGSTREASTSTWNDTTAQNARKPDNSAQSAWEDTPQTPEERTRQLDSGSRHLAVAQRGLQGSQYASGANTEQPTQERVNAQATVAAQTPRHNLLPSIWIQGTDDHALNSPLGVEEGMLSQQCSKVAFNQATGDQR